MNLADPFLYSTTQPPTRKKLFREQNYKFHSEVFFYKYFVFNDKNVLNFFITIIIIIIININIIIIININIMIIIVVAAAVRG